MELNSTDYLQQQLINSTNRASMITKQNFNKQDSLISKLLGSIIKTKVDLQLSANQEGTSVHWFQFQAQVKMLAIIPL